MEKVGASGDDALRIFVFIVLIKMASTEVSFRHDIKTMLKSVSSKDRNGSIIDILKGRNHCRRSLWPGDFASLRDHHQDDTQFQCNQMIGVHFEIQEL